MLKTIRTRLPIVLMLLVGAIFAGRAALANDLGNIKSARWPRGLAPMG